MKLKEKIIVFSVLAFFLLLLYTFLAVKPVGSELEIHTKWTISLLQEKSLSPDFIFEDKEIYPFMLGNRMGYFTETGELVCNTIFEERASISSFFQAQYTNSAAQTDIFDSTGTITGTVAQSGFIHFVDERIYLFLPGGSGVSEYNAKGELLWTYEDVLPLIAFHSSPAAVVLGFADGKLVCLSAQGTELFSFYPRGSTYEIIFGTAISSDGSLVAALCGLDSQRFVLMRVTNGQSKVIFHEYMHENLQRQSYVHFDKKNAYVIYEYAQGIGIVDIQNMKSKSIPIRGSVVSIQESADSSLFFILTEAEDEYILSVIEKPGNLIAQNAFTAENAFILSSKNALYLGSDDTISRIDIIKK